MAVVLPQPRRATIDLARVRTWVRPALVLGTVLMAYRTSLATLFEAMRLDTPVAHVALVPFIALALAIACRTNDPGPAIHDRQLDWIIGLALCAGAMLANIVLPARLSTEFWEWHVDLLTLPFFVAGAVSIVFGVRTLWKYRVAVLFMFLAWPYPYTLALQRYLGDFTNATISSLDMVLRHVPVAAKVAGTDATFQVLHAGRPIQMSVASTCSGANGLVGFTLVAGAFLLVVDGPRRRKLLWLAVGGALVWLLNLVRILVIFWAAEQWGQRVAIDGFHPYTGLVVFNLAVVAMILVMRPFGLRFRRRPARSAPPDPARPWPTTRRAPTFVSMGIVGLMALGVGMFNGNLRQYDGIADSIGSPRLASFADSRETPSGWRLDELTEYDQYRRFFGNDSTWVRYQYAFQGSGAEALQANVPITADVIDTSDRAAFSAYGVEACYTFHDYAVHGRQSVDLGSGVVGGLLTWTSPATTLTWTTLYWHWPIKTPSGTRYERVTLVMNDQPTNRFTSPPLSTSATRALQLNIDDALRGVGATPADNARLLATRQFMIGFARQLITLRAPAP